MLSDENLIVHFFTNLLIFDIKYMTETDFKCKLNKTFC